MEWSDFGLMVYFLVIAGCMVALVILGFKFLGQMSEDRYQAARSSYVAVQDCSINGVPVDCGWMWDNYPDMANHNWKKMNGVCPGINETLEDCK